MRGCKLVVLMCLVGLAIGTPAMAWDYFSVGVSYGHGHAYSSPVVVEEPVYVADPVVVESAPIVVERPVIVDPVPVIRTYSYCEPVVYPRFSVGFTYVGGHHRDAYYFGGHGGYHGDYHGGYYGGHHGRGTVVRVRH
jgi:hypothetical protein